MIDALGRRTTHTYDERGNKIQTVYADDTSEGWAYDPANRMVAITNKAGQVTLSLYDKLRRKYATSSPMAPAPPTLLTPSDKSPCTSTTKPSDARR